MNESNTSELPEDQLPQEVVAELRERHGPEIPVPKSLNAAILADAERHLHTISRPISAKSGSRKLVWAMWSTGTLAAAMLLFALLPSTSDMSRSADFAAKAMPDADSRIAIAESASLSGDVDGDGHIDILDAFAMARIMNAGDADAARWDQNGDGQMNQADINLVALNAVML